MTENESADTGPLDSADAGPLDRDTVRSTSRIAVTALALVGVLYLLTLLPGLDRLVPFTPVTFAAVVTAVVTAAVVALLLYAAPKAASLTRAGLHRSDAGERVKRVAENTGAVVYWLVALVAVIVAHGGFAGAITPMLDGLAWAYDAAFLIASLVPLVFLVARLTVTVDPLSEVIADRVAGDDTSAEEPSGDGSTDT